MPSSRGHRRRALVALVAIASAAILSPSISSATVEEQRARLPPAANCPDLVEGVWLASRFSEKRSEWYEYTLEIHRVEPDGGVLKGEMATHYWSGSDQDEKPPACKPGAYDIVVKMPGKGTVDQAGNVAFGAKSYVNDKALCGVPLTYNPDNFTGKIDPELQEFQSVNNDGGNAVNEPTVFRRIRCLESARLAKTGDEPKPPAFAPPKRARFKCGR